MLEVGSKAPLFSLPDQNGVIHNLEDYLGKEVVLYFYPKDNTSGCSKQACNFRDLYPQFMEKGAVVLGVSKDSVASHKKFEENYGLPFPLLSDPSVKTLEDYGVWQQKSMYGRKYMGAVRATYLIDEKGYIKKVVAKAKPDSNPSEMLESL